jgi:hypothetical protein
MTIVSTSTNSHPSPRDDRSDRAFPGSHESSEDQFGRHLRYSAAMRAARVSVVADLFEEAFEIARNLD